jgi:hypothetical protein
MMVPDPKGAAKAGREGFDLTIRKLNPLKKPESEKFDSWVTGPDDKPKARAKKK